MIWSEIKAVDTKGTVNGFLDAIEIWRKKPHVVNRRLCGAHIVWTNEIAPKGDHTLDDSVLLLLSHRRKLLNSDLCKVDVNTHLNIIQETFETISSNSNFDDAGTRRWTITVRHQIHKQAKNVHKTVEIVIIDKVSLEAVFLPFCGIGEENCTLMPTNDFAYKVSLDSKCGKIVLCLCDAWNSDLDLTSSGYSTNWLSDVLIMKLARWSEEEKLNTEVTSLRLIDIERYNQVYNELKSKYGKHLVEIWPEQTDPSKFVYEDIGIASYLLVLWEMERKSKGLTARQSFVDIGCGNGLLVYLLTLEGHPGIGLDIRKRKIWDFLSDVANLKECTVNPSDESVFPDHDWLIGNHSDELTPWIPVITARSHYNCRYFVIPCCAWDFQEKFSCNGRGPSTSQYNSYLEFVKEVGVVCGFNVERDTLRIPSTKRVCFLGLERSYLPADESSVDANRREYIADRCRTRSAKIQRVDPVKSEQTSSSGSDETFQNSNQIQQHSLSDLGHNHKESENGFHGGSNIESRTNSSDVVINAKESSVWLETFQPRSATEKPRNAVCLDQSVKDLMSVTVMNRILLTTNLVTMATGQDWNRGGNLPLNEASQLFDRNVLLQLKNECGGLQTLLKNCPDVFIVRDGSIQLRDWTSPEYVEYRASRNRKRPNSVVKANEVRKTKMCFFFKNHPHGCPLVSENCRFAHGSEDLNSRS